MLAALKTILHQAHREELFCLLDCFVFVVVVVNVTGVVAVFRCCYCSCFRNTDVAVLDIYVVHFVTFHKGFIIVFLVVVLEAAAAGAVLDVVGHRFCREGLFSQIILSFSLILAATYGVRALARFPK